jgi:CubicO group peptidase (beta-lactamase class C family)
MKFIKWAVAILFAGVLILVAFNYPKLTIISGYAAKNMASTVFIAGRSPASINQNDHDVPMIEMAETSLGQGKKSATATVFGLMEREAVCRTGLGCILLPPGAESLPAEVAPMRAIETDSLPFPYGNAVAGDTLFGAVDYAKLEKAVDLAFDANETQRTRTVLIAYKNSIIAERYTDGFTAETPVLGWSMTKSVLATLYGVLEYQGKINLQEAAGIRSWETDSRSEITIDDLLRMQSGLAWDEDYSRISDVTRMLFLEKDMAAVQVDKKAVAAPGEVWNYSSGTSNLLAALLRRKFNSQQEYLNFPYHHLIDKIGMGSMLIETDAAGNFVGSSYGWASTRDWAKFGLLYLNEGIWNNTRLFSPEWTDYVTRPTRNSDRRYGAHFWLNEGGHYPGVPRDLYSANGYQGQYVFIIPSLDLVIVRTGLAEPPEFNLLAFLQAVTGAIRNP